MINVSKTKKTFGNVKEQKSLVFYTCLEILLMLMIVLEGFQPHLEQGESIKYIVVL